jgi:hypothetical protein
MNFYREHDGILTLRVLLAAAALASFVALMSCSAEVRNPRHEMKDHAYGEDFVYRETPLDLRIESTSRVAPISNYGWGGGYWTRYNDRWNWVDSWMDPGSPRLPVGAGTVALDGKGRAG